MLTNIQNMHKGWMTALLLWLPVFLNAAGAQENIKGFKNSGKDQQGIFLKCFELQQKLLFKENRASDNELMINRDNQNNQNVFVTGQKSESIESNSNSASNMMFFESWNTSGELNWKIPYQNDTELFQITGNKIYSLKLLPDDELGGTRKLLLREVSQATGLAIWQNSVEIKSFGAVHTADLKLQRVGNFLLIVESKSGAVYKLSPENGKLTSLQEFKAPLRVFASQSDREDSSLFLTDSENNLYRFSAEKFSGDKNTDGNLIIVKLPSLNSVAEIVDIVSVPAENAFYLTTADNKISKFDAGRVKTMWSLRTGAAISAFSVYSDWLFVVSLDNFVYCLDKKSGRRKWKKRLPGRSLASPLVIGESLILPIFGDRLAVVLDAADGSQKNRLQLDEGKYFLQNSLTSADRIFLDTSDGIKVYANDGLCTKKK